MARKHRFRRILMLSLVVTGLAAAFQPANAAGADTGSASATIVSAQASTGGKSATKINVSAPSTALSAGVATEEAITMITGSQLPNDVLSHIPADFSQVMGYTPVVGHLANGTPVAINPKGGCSVIGGGRPFDLAVACKAHDLGYDLLRYAHHHGADLSPRARHLVDDKFGTDLFTQCAALYTGGRSQACDVMAASFDAGVGFNSWRQDFGAPISDAGQVRTIGILGLGLILLYFLARRTLRVVNRSLQRMRGRGPVLAIDAASA